MQLEYPFHVHPSWRVLLSQGALLKRPYQNLFDIHVNQNHQMKFSITEPYLIQIRPQPDTSVDMLSGVRVSNWYRITFQGLSTILITGASIRIRIVE